MKKQEPRTISVYRSYNFKNKNPIIDLLRTIMQDLGWSCQKLADETGLSHSCVWQIFEGETCDPRHSTVARMAIAFGHADMAIAPEAKPKLRAIAGGKAHRAA